MPIDPTVKPLAPIHDRFTPEREMLAHARQQADALDLDDYFIVDVDSHREPSAVWPEVLTRMENPVIRENSLYEFHANTHGEALYVPIPGGAGLGFQAMHGRIPHQEYSRA